MLRSFFIPREAASMNREDNSFKLDLCHAAAILSQEISKALFMLHVPLHIMKVIDVGGVSLWVSSVCWDTK